MKVIKVINNNVVSSLDDKEREVIVLGKGIGFKKNPGDNIDEGAIEKVFRLPSASQNQFEKLVDQIPYEYVKYVDEIVRYATECLGKKLNKSVYITLTDHIAFAIERQKQGIAFSNALLWEIKKFYRAEYEIGKHALDIIKREEHVELPVDEAAFIALHIVNAEMDGNLDHSMTMPSMMKDVVNIIRYTFQVEMDEDSLCYERFITHLKFFLQRAVTNDFYPEDADTEFYEAIKTKHSKEYACSEKICSYVKNKTGYIATEEERIYLTVHIARVIRRSEQELITE